MLFVVGYNFERLKLVLVQEMLLTTACKFHTLYLAELLSKKLVNSCNIQLPPC
jgi:hypothetical protein